MFIKVAIALFVVAALTGGMIGLVFYLRHDSKEEKTSFTSNSFNENGTTFPPAPRVSTQKEQLPAKPNTKSQRQAEPRSYHQDLQHYPRESPPPPSSVINQQSFRDRSPHSARPLPAVGRREQASPRRQSSVRDGSCLLMTRVINFPEDDPDSF